LEGDVEKIIVLTIVFISILLLLLKLIRMFKGKDPGCSSCEGCEIDSCNERENDRSIREDK